jgi:hypothetical protein
MRHLITTIPQVDGGLRHLYAETRREAERARAELRRDPATLECIGPSEIVDEDAAGRRVLVRS